MGAVGDGPTASRIFTDVVTNGEGDQRDCRDATSVRARCDSRSNQRVANCSVAEGCLGHSWNINLRLSTLIEMSQFQSRVVRERGVSQISLRDRSRLMRLAPLIVVVALASYLFGDVPATASSSGSPRFVSSASAVSATQLGTTWRVGCPIAPSQLRLLRLSYFGFDGRAQVGSMVVNAKVVTAVIQIFATLYRDRFPLHSMIPESRYGGHDPASMAADNTSGFNCRYAVASGTPHWSAHAFGEAIDVNPVQNPYLVNGVAEPISGMAYRDRGVVRPGMAVNGGVLVNAFAYVKWYWGGRWTASPDYQHFSASGG